jgi:hypothetical protein
MLTGWTGAYQATRMEQAQAEARRPGAKEGAHAARGSGNVISHWGLGPLGRRVRAQSAARAACARRARARRAPGQHPLYLQGPTTPAACSPQPAACSYALCTMHGGWRLRLRLPLLPLPPAACRLPPAAAGATCHRHCRHRHPRPRPPPPSPSSPPLAALARPRRPPPPPVRADPV